MAQGPLSQSERGNCQTSTDLCANPPREYTAKVWGEAEVPRGRTALTEEPGIGYTGGAWSYWSK
jgi:hypothetical protein